MEQVTIRILKQRHQKFVKKRLTEINDTEEKNAKDLHLSNKVLISIQVIQVTESDIIESTNNVKRKNTSISRTVGFGVEKIQTPLHPLKLTVWCALCAGEIIGIHFFKYYAGQNATVNGKRYKAIIVDIFVPQLDVKEHWFLKDGSYLYGLLLLLFFF